MIQVSRISPMTGKINTLDLDVMQTQLDELKSPRRRAIQDIFPNLTAAEREFLLSGYTAEDWAKMFPPEEDGK